MDQPIPSSKIGERELAALADAVMRVARTNSAVLEAARMDTFDGKGVRGFAVAISNDGRVYQEIRPRDDDSSSAISLLRASLSGLELSDFSIVALVGFGEMTDPRRRGGPRSPGSVRALCVHIAPEFQGSNQDLEHFLTYSVEGGDLKFYDMLEYNYATHGKPLARVVKPLD